MGMQAILFVIFMMAFLSTYLPFSPLTIDLVNLSREQQLWLYRRRHLIWSIGIVAAGAVIGLDIGRAIGIGGWTIAVAIGGGALALMYWTGYVPIVMSPPRNARRIAPDQPDSRIAGDTVVLGIAIGDLACAYLRDEIARPHYFVDHLCDMPVIISYCILCNSSTAFRASLDGRTLDLRCVTAYNNNIIYRDVVRENYIQQLDGQVIAGPDLGRSLEMLPVVQTTWAGWSRLYPHSTLFRSPPTAVRDRLVGMMLQWMIPLHKLAKRSAPWHRLHSALDRRHPAMAFVLGVEIGSAQRAYPLDVVIGKGVINDTLDGDPLVILSDPRNHVAQVYSRNLHGRVLSFEAIPGCGADRDYIDRETGTTWSAAGVAISGPLAASQLKPIAHFNKLFWFSWAMFKPRTDLWDDRPRQTGADSDPATFHATSGGEP